MKLVDGHTRTLFLPSHLQMVLPNNNSLDKSIEIIQSSMSGYQVRYSNESTSEGT